MYMTDEQVEAILAHEAAQKHARTPWREEVWERLGVNVPLDNRVLTRLG